MVFKLFISIIILHSAILDLRQEDIFLGHLLSNGGSGKLQHELPEGPIPMEYEERAVDHVVPNYLLHGPI